MVCATTGVGVRKLNLDTRQLVPVAAFPTEKCINGVGWLSAAAGNENQFNGQGARLAFSRDFSKIVTSSLKGGQVGYYDNSTNSVVNVSALLQPATGDFDKKPDHSTPGFTADGLFSFLDNEARVFKFFDTSTRQLVKQQDKPDIPRYLEPVLDGWDDFHMTASVRTCRGIWSLPEAGRFISDNNTLVESDLPPGTRYSCEPTYPNSQVLNPERPKASTVGADPTGALVVFLIDGKDGKPHFYKSNFANPDSPERLALPQEAELDDRMLQLIGWE
ncbi:Uncharacterised protein [Mycobacteroides abscessus subsp. abscessus]|nr:Uncharacterised protein [Mycobacteroides abscessus subsp. abscessus]